MSEPFLFVATLALALVLGAIFPLLAGFGLQLAVRHRVLPLALVLLAALVLSILSWVWGVGFSMAIPGPPFFGHGALFLFHCLFIWLGAVVARRWRARAAGATPGPTEA